jgi:hypothetical protein
MCGQLELNLLTIRTTGVESCAGSWNYGTRGDGDAPGINVPSHSTVSAMGDAAYGPLLLLGRTCDVHTVVNVSVDVQLLPPSSGYHRLGDALALINGVGHRIRIWSEDLTKEAPVPLRIKLGWSGVSPCVAQSNYLCNLSPQPVYLGPMAHGNTVWSVGPVNDTGTANVVKRISVSDLGAHTVAGMEGSLPHACQPFESV